MNDIIWIASEVTELPANRQTFELMFIPQDHREVLEWLAENLSAASSAVIEMKSSSEAGIARVVTEDAKLGDLIRKTWGGDA